MHYYKFNLKDYAVSTPHLTNEEDLCYRRLLDLYYLDERPIADAMHVLCRRLRIEEKTIRDVLEEFFVLVNGEWHHARCDEEIASSKAITERKSAAAQKRWDAPAKQKQSTRNAPAKQKQCISNALPSTHNPLPSNNTPIVPTGDSELVLVTEDSDPSDDQPHSGYPSDFETFWAAFPEKKGKGAAWRAFEKVQKYGALPPMAELVDVIHAQQLDRQEAKRRGEFYPEWKNPSTWLNGHCWADGLKYPQKKERAAAESSAPEQWRELLVDQYSENYPDGLASSNFPTAFHLLPASVQEEIRQAAALRTEITEEAA